MKDCSTLFRGIFGREMSSRGQSVHVWDPNPFNSYGFEVARAIAASGRSVSYWGRPGCLSTASVRRLRVLPAAGASRTVRGRVAYALGVLAFFLRMSFTRKTVVVTWTNSRLEDRGVLLLQRLGVPTVLIVHNPVSSRDPRNRVIDSMRTNATRVVVHEERLRGYFDRQVQVVSHPSYSGWKDAQERSKVASSDADSSGRPVLLFFGTFRRDKGIEDLASIDEWATERGAVLRIVVGKVPPSEQPLIDRCVTAEVLTDRETYTPDAILYRELSRADVLVAPYSDVTASGTIILALTMGLPVACYRGETLSEMDRLGGAVSPGNTIELVDMALALATSPAAATAAKRAATELDARSIGDWDELLTGIEIQR